MEFKISSQGFGIGFVICSLEICTLDFGILDLEFGVWGFEIVVLALRFQVSEFKFEASDLENEIFKFSILSFVV